MEESSESIDIQYRETDENGGTTQGQITMNKFGLALIGEELERVALVGGLTAQAREDGVRVSMQVGGEGVTIEVPWDYDSFVATAGRWDPAIEGVVFAALNTALFSQ